ncbi:hypothetical protein ABFX02_01G106600 [Erythranthe guttata]
MGRLFVKELREAPHIVCINCRTCIALLRHKVHLPPDEAEENVGVFRKVVNVQVEEYQNYQVGPHTVTNIYCVKCRNELGCQYVRQYQTIFCIFFSEVFYVTIVVFKDSMLKRCYTYYSTDSSCWRAEHSPRWICENNDGADSRNQGRRGTLNSGCATNLGNLAEVDNVFFSVLNFRLLFCII